MASAKMGATGRVLSLGPTLGGAGVGGGHLLDRALGDALQGRTHIDPVGGCGVDFLGAGLQESLHRLHQASGGGDLVVHDQGGFPLHLSHQHPDPHLGVGYPFLVDEGQGKAEAPG